MVEFTAATMVLSLKCRVDSAPYGDSGGPKFGGWLLRKSQMPRSGRSRLTEASDINADLVYGTAR